MREESHLDDMRAAIRGDFQRLEERRGEQQLMRPVDEEEGEAPAQVTEPEPEPEPIPEPEPDPVPEPEPEPTEEQRPELEPAASAEQAIDEDTPRRTWLDRLLGRGAGRRGL